MIPLLKASSFYPKYLTWFYRANPALATASYAQQHKALMEDRFGFSDSWRRYLSQGSNRFDVTELVVNAEPLQKQWAKENSVSYREASWLQDIFFAQFMQSSPKILFAHAPEIDPRLRQRCKTEATCSPAIITYDGIGRHTSKVYDQADLVLTCLRESCHFYRSKGVASHWMMFGFDPAVLSQIDRSVPTSPVSFIGGMELRIGHQERAILLAEVSRQIGLETWINALPDDLTLLRLWASFARHRDWKAFARFPKAAISARRLRGQNHGELYGVRMLSRLAASGISLNVHIAAAGNQAANIRLFEATGVGSCLVTDWKDNIPEIFEPDREVVVFRSPAEAIEKIRYLLTHDDERRQIAERGQKRTLAAHHYADRLRELSPLLLELVT